MKALRLFVLVMMTALLMVGCGGDDKDDSIKMEDMAGVYEYIEEISGYLLREAFVFFDDGVGIYLWYSDNLSKYQKSEPFDYEIDKKTAIAYVHGDTLEFSISKVDDNYQLTLSLTIEGYGEAVEKVFSHIDMEVTRGVITEEFAVNVWDGEDSMYKYKYTFNSDRSAIHEQTRKYNNSVVTVEGTWDYMVGMMGIVMSRVDSYDPTQTVHYNLFAEGDSLNPTLNYYDKTLNINYDALYAGVYQTQSMGGFSEYICLWDDKTGETGDVFPQIGNDRSFVVTWEATASTLTLTYALEYPWTWNQVTDTYNITKNGDVIVLTDQEDPDYVYTKTTSLEVNRVVMTADQVVGTWVPNYGGENLLLNSGGSASLGDDSNQKWEFAASPHVIYVIDSENYWIELTGTMDNGILKLKDIDNSMTYTKQ